MNRFNTYLFASLVLVTNVSYGMKQIFFDQQEERQYSFGHAITSGQVQVDSNHCIIFPHYEKSNKSYKINFDMAHRDFFVLMKRGSVNRMFEMEYTAYQRFLYSEVEKFFEFFQEKSLLSNIDKKFEVIDYTINELERTIFIGEAIKEITFFQPPDFSKERELESINQLKEAVKELEQTKKRANEYFYAKCGDDHDLRSKEFLRLGEIVRTNRLELFQAVQNKDFNAFEQACQKPIIFDQLMEQNQKDSN